MIMFECIILNSFSYVRILYIFYLIYYRAFTFKKRQLNAKLIANLK